VFRTISACLIWLVFVSSVRPQGGSSCFNELLAVQFFRGMCKMVGCMSSYCASLVIAPQC